MKQIPGQVLSYSTSGPNLTKMTVDEVRSSAGHCIATYSELISKLAHLAYANPDFVLLMRGQTRDFTEDGKSTLLPTMYRMPEHGDNFYAVELQQRYEELLKCERRLYDVLRDTQYWDRVGRNELARWAILQHYEVCPTPLLDVTHSALVACSFAFLKPTQNNQDHFFLFVLGVPQISGAITVSPSHALQVVRLSSVCPPETLRPYFQEGYLIGNYPSVDTFDEKMRYARSEMDGAQRLVAKFRIRTSSSFWDNGFNTLPRSAVYPLENSGLCRSLSSLKEQP